MRYVSGQGRSVLRQRMLNEQGGRCADCPKVLDVRGSHVDHDHKTMETRAVVCPSCNQKRGARERRDKRSGRTIRVSCVS